jgi:hypothetical protein
MTSVGLQLLCAMLTGAGALLLLLAERPLRATTGLLTASIGATALLAVVPGMHPLVPAWWLLLVPGLLGATCWAVASVVQRAEEERGRRRWQAAKLVLVVPVIAMAVLWWRNPMSFPAVASLATVPNTPPLEVLMAVAVAGIAPIVWGRARPVFVR